MRKPKHKAVKWIINTKARAELKQQVLGLKESWTGNSVPSKTKDTDRVSPTVTEPSYPPALRPDL